MFKFIIGEIEPKTSIYEQIQKVKEEDIEFLIGVSTKDTDNIIEEFFDTIQVKLSLMNKIGISMKQLEEGNKKHLEKIKSRGWEVK